jgi:hypothetical protein
MEFIRMIARVYENPYWKGYYKITITVYFFYEDLPLHLKHEIEDELDRLGFRTKHSLWYVYGKYCKVYEKYEAWLKFKSREEAEEYAEKLKERIRSRLAEIYSEHLGMMRFVSRLER